MAHAHVEAARGGNGGRPHIHIRQEERFIVHESTWRPPRTRATKRRPLRRRSYPAQVRAYLQGRGQEHVHGRVPARLGDAAEPAHKQVAAEDQQRADSSDDRSAGCPVGVQVTGRSGTDKQHQRDRAQRNDVDAKALAVVTPGILGPDYFREVAAILDAAAGGPPDFAALGDVMRRHGLTPAP